MRTRRLGVAAALVDGALIAGDVSIADGRVAEVGLVGPGSGIAVPGLIDVQVNGFGGVDLLTADDDEAWQHVGERLLALGVTAYLPTLITAPVDVVRSGLRRAARVMQLRAQGARILGVHLEGPFLSPERLGAHPREHRRDPDPDLLARLLAAGPVSMVTLAPELDGAAALIDMLSERRVVASIGHSAAPAGVVHAAFDRGARAVTHIFNAMAPIASRQPGVAGVALSRPDVTVMCILDGVHLAAETASLVLAAAGDRLSLVSDSIAAAGVGDGRYLLGTEMITARGGKATRDDGTLAGSLGNVADGVRRAVELGATVKQAVTAVSAAPARLLGRGDVGMLSPGVRADLVVLDDSLTVARVLYAGSPVERADP
ncbi:MAG: N-acetylglucosamine-6-phosphate deacetylase [Solirubrobacteraceae bacterium]